MSDDGTVACLRVTAAEDRADELCWCLERARATSIETRDASTMTAEQAGRILLLAGFSDARSRDEARATVAGRAGATEVAAVDVGDDGWSIGWREFHRPVVLERLEVLTPWMEPSAGARTAIVIDPGRAFGTGGHATTGLVLEMLERRSATGRLDQVLDVGTGSGVLAIAAIKLGARGARAIDNDPEAVEAARENARRNGVDGVVEISKSEPSDLRGEHRLVLANIDLPVFRRCAADISELVATEGEVLISGLLEEQVDDCLGLWPGYEVVERCDRGEWSALALRKAR